MQTRALLPGSPAIGAGTCAYSDPANAAQTLTVDGRNIAGPQGASCDIGAFEGQGFTLTSPTGDNQSATVGATFPTAPQVTLTATDAGVPTSGAGISFMLSTQSNGATATFGSTSGTTGTLSTSNGNPVATCTTDGNGVATAPLIVAGATAGTIAVSIGGQTPGVTNPRTFTETITPLPTTTVQSINRAGNAAQLTNAATVNYTVTFASPVSGVTASDFTLTVTGGITGASIGTPTTTDGGTTYTVPVNTGTGEGDLRLDLTSNVGLMPPDSNPPFITGQVYTLDRTAPTFAPVIIPPATVGQSYTSGTITASDAHSPFIGSVASDDPGITYTQITGNTGNINGTSLRAGTSHLTLSAVDTAGNRTTQPYTLTVNKATPSVAVTSGTMGAVTVGQPVTFTAVVTGFPGAVPTSTVTFTYTPPGGAPTSLGPTQSLAAGTTPGTATATISTSALPLGASTITATYSCDANFLTAMGSVMQTVKGAPPLARDDSYTTLANTPLTVTAARGLLVNDTPGTPLATASKASGPAHGVATVNSDGSFTYTPTTNYVGGDSFTYTLTSSAGTSTATVRLTVTAASVTALTLTAPAGGASGNSGTSAMPVVKGGDTLALTVVGVYNNGTTGPVTGLTFMSSKPDAGERRRQWGATCPYRRQCDDHCDGPERCERHDHGHGKHNDRKRADDPEPAACNPTEWLASAR